MPFIQQATIGIQTEGDRVENLISEVERKNHELEFMTDEKTRHKNNNVRLTQRVICLESELEAFQTKNTRLDNQIAGLKGEIQKYRTSVNCPPEKCRVDDEEIMQEEDVEITKQQCMSASCVSDQQKLHCTKESCCADDDEHKLQCVKCKELFHYVCTKLPT